MYKYMFSTLLLPAILCANITDLQRLYDQKNYIEVIEESKKRTILYGDAKLHVLWGKSAEALGRVEEAISAYERVLMITPDNATVRVKLAELYVKTNRTFLGKQLAEDLEDYQLTDDERVTIMALISDDKTWSTFASIGFGYDSNINVSPADLDIPASEDVISSRFVRYQAGLIHTYVLDDNSDKLYLRSGASFSYQDNEAGYFNLFAGVVNTGLGYKNDAYDAYVPLIYSRIHYLNRDLLESVGTHPSVDMILLKSLIMNLNAKYLKRTFIQESDALMDDSVWGAGVGLYWLFNDNLAYFKMNFDDYSAKYEEESQYIEKNAIAFATGINYQVNHLWTVSGSYSFCNTSYEDTLPLSHEKRSDEFHKLGIELSSILMEDLEMSLQYSYTVNQSNNTISEYDKNIVMCNLKYKY